MVEHEAADGGHGASRRDLAWRLGLLAGRIGNGALEGVDPDAIASRIDVDELVSRIDVDALMARVDPDDVVERVDVNRLLDRVDVNRLLDRVDVDRLLDRVDVNRIVRRADVGGVIGAGTGQVAGSALDLVRRQAVGLDVVVMRSVQRLRGRDPTQLPAGPSELVGDATGSGPSLDDADRVEVTGHYAGPLTRLAALAGDGTAVAASFTALSAGLAHVIGIVFGVGVGTESQSGPLWLAALLLWGLLYFAVSLAVAGRTPAMAALGLRVVTRAGATVSPRQALVRTLTLPVAVLPFGAGLVGLLLHRERLALHDLAAGTAVVYDWGGREASLPSPLSRWIRARAR